MTRPTEDLRVELFEARVAAGECERTHVEIGRVLGVDPSRVRQIEQRALARLRAALAEVLS